jgi:hypothetical protein
MCEPDSSIRAPNIFHRSPGEPKSACSDPGGGRHAEPVIRLSTIRR